MRVLSALALALAAGSAAAETVRVRSGEHPGFSRLVVELGEPGDWRLVREGSSYVLETGRAGLSFDLSEVYRLIPRTRIASLTQDAATGRLTIALGCDCSATAKVHRGNWIVVDVADGAPASESRGSAAAHPEEPAQAEAPRDIFGEGRRRFAGSAGRSIVFLAPPSRPEEDVLQLPPWSAAWQDRLPAAPADAGSEARASAEASVQDQRARLLEELARAAAQGLVEADLPALDAATAPFERDEPAPREGPPPVPEPAPVEHVRIEAETSVDRDSGSSTEARAATAEGHACIDDSELDFGAWGGSGDVPATLADRRMALVGEFDHPDEDAVLALARYYLHLGFGAEARATLSAFGTTGERADRIAALAAVLDGSDEGLPGPLAHQAGCGGRASLWSVLAEGGPRRDSPADAAAVLAAFSALPLHLRRHLGPRLAQQFLDAGQGETARLIRNAVARAPGDHGPAQGLVEARLALAEGDPGARAALADLVAQDDGVAPEAFAELLRSELEAEDVSESAADTAAAFAFEAAGTPTGRDLAHLAVRAKLTSGEFEDARLEILRLQAEGLAKGTDLWPVFAEALARGAPDADLLRQVFAAGRDLDEAPLPEPIATALATRLTSLGFGDQALRFLDPAADAEPARLARADALIATGDARGAIDALDGLAGSAAERLRARALADLGDLRGAAVGFAAIGDTRAAEQAAWAAEAWDLLAEAPSETARTVAERALSRQSADRGAAETLPPGPAGGSLPGPSPEPVAGDVAPGRVERARQALENLAAARAAISRLADGEPAQRP